MNSLKTMLIVVVLAVIAGAVYVSINNPEPVPPPGIAEGWSGPPNIEMPNAATSGFPFDSAGSGPATESSGTGPGGLAPPFAPSQPLGDTLAGNMPSPVASTNPSDDPLGSPSQFAVGSDGPGPSQMPQPTDQPLDGARSNEVRKAFFNFLQAAREELQQGNLVEVLEKLSVWYDTPQLTAEEHRQLTDLLDQVAGTVVYSREHLLERPYVVKPGDNLQRIARAYGVPWQLLAKINGVRDPENLDPGEELKVVRGPFDAMIRLDNYEMTLMLRDLYAGRFRIGLGGDPQDLEGTYLVEDKTVHTEPINPLGKYRIKLTDQIGIHGTSDPRNLGSSGGPGSIFLGDQDLEDVHDILSIGSRVRIVR